jgi:hypothetical protein
MSHSGDTDCDGRRQVQDMVDDAKRRHVQANPDILLNDVKVLLMLELPTFDSTGPVERAVPTLWLADRIASRWRTLFVDEGLTTKNCPL